MIFLVFCIAATLLKAADVEQLDRAFGDKSRREAMALKGVKLPPICFEKWSSEGCRRELEAWMKTDDGRDGLKRVEEVTKALDPSLWRFPHQHYRLVLMALLENQDEIWSRLGKAIDEKLLNGEEVEDEMKILSGLINVSQLSSECGNLTKGYMYLIGLLFLETSKPGVFHYLKKLDKFRYTRYFLTTRTEKGTKLSLLMTDREGKWNVKRETEVSENIAAAAMKLEKQYVAETKRVHPNKLAGDCPVMFVEDPVGYALLFTVKNKSLDVSRKGYDKLYEVCERDRKSSEKEKRDPLMRTMLARHLTGASAITDLDALSKHLEEYLKKPFDELYWHYRIINGSNGEKVDKTQVKLNLTRAIIKNSKLDERDRAKALSDPLHASLQPREVTKVTEVQPKEIDESVQS